MKLNSMKPIMLFLGAYASLNCAAESAMASDQKGARSIIAEHCIECHRVPGFAEEVANPAIVAPDFQTIADDPKTYSAERLHAFLRAPHFPMRALILSEGDITSLIDYIQGLRTSSSKID